MEVRTTLWSDFPNRGQAEEPLPLELIRCLFYLVEQLMNYWRVGLVAKRETCFKSPEIVMNVLGYCVCKLATTELMTSQTAFAAVKNKVYATTRITQVYSFSR